MIEGAVTGRAVDARASRGEAVWERLWRHKPSDERDDSMLDRERRSGRWSLIVSRVESVLGSLEGLRTVELGSGRGDLSALLVERGARVTLVDTCAAALEQAEARFRRRGLSAEYVQLDMFKAARRYEGRFDVSLSSGVIEHFRGDERTRTLAAHHDVLRPGGIAVVSVPHAWCIPYRLWKAYLELRGWWPYGMEIPYSRFELARRARRAGLIRTQSHCLEFRHALGSQFARTFLGFNPDWRGRRSILDGLMGLVLLMFAQRPMGNARREPSRDRGV